MISPQGDIKDAYEKSEESFFQEMKCNTEHYNASNSTPLKQTYLECCNNRSMFQSADSTCNDGFEKQKMHIPDHYLNTTTHLSGILPEKVSSDSVIQNWDGRTLLGIPEDHHCEDVTAPDNNREIIVSIINAMVDSLVANLEAESVIAVDLEHIEIAFKNLHITSPESGTSDTRNPESTGGLLECLMFTDKELVGIRQIGCSPEKESIVRKSEQSVSESTGENSAYIKETTDVGSSCDFSSDVKINTHQEPKLHNYSIKTEDYLNDTNLIYERCVAITPQSTHNSRNKAIPNGTLSETKNDCRTSKSDGYIISKTSEDFRQEPSTYSVQVYEKVDVLLAHQGNGNKIKIHKSKLPNTDIEELPDSVTSMVSEIKRITRKKLIEKKRKVLKNIRGWNQCIPQQSRNYGGNHMEMANKMRKTQPKRHRRSLAKKHISPRIRLKFRISKEPGCRLLETCAKPTPKFQKEKRRKWVNHGRNDQSLAARVQNIIDSNKRLAIEFSNHNWFLKKYQANIRSEYATEFVDNYSNTPYEAAKAGKRTENVITKNKVLGDTSSKAVIDGKQTLEDRPQKLSIAFTRVTSECYTLNTDVDRTTQHQINPDSKKPGDSNDSAPCKNHCSINQICYEDKRDAIKTTSLDVSSSTHRDMNNTSKETGKDMRNVLSEYFPMSSLHTTFNTLSPIGSSLSLPLTPSLPAATDMMKIGTDIATHISRTTQGKLVASKPIQYHTLFEEQERAIQQITPWPSTNLTQTDGEPWGKHSCQSTPTQTSIANDGNHRELDSFHNHPLTAFEQWKKGINLEGNFVPINGKPVGTRGPVLPKPFTSLTYHQALSSNTQGLVTPLYHSVTKTNGKHDIPGIFNREMPDLEKGNLYGGVMRPNFSSSYSATPMHYVSIVHTPQKMSYPHYMFSSGSQTTTCSSNGLNQPTYGQEVSTSFINKPNIISTFQHNMVSSFPKTVMQTQSDPVVSRPNQSLGPNIPSIHHYSETESNALRYQQQGQLYFDARPTCMQSSYHQLDCACIPLPRKAFSTNATSFNNVELAKTGISQQVGVILQRSQQYISYSIVS
ncbi:hypothetical protein LSH36_14g09004 [Paralvinella palmiformis]|uniref:Uncharacterized protein n=1 Tax=Paralvinella palmiformis TaxID=53620 RepID=A0AAD9NHI8_9ANNE|nr:hypothetical protein LSH36_14g09004 [Paralvinella palmiformis]